LGTDQAEARRRDRVKPLLYLIDGSSQMYRAYHAPIRTADGTLLRNAQGRPTNAVYIFVTMLRKLLKEHGPQYIGASFDLPGRTFRDELAADYKANRTPMPDELAAQIPLVHRACEALGVPIVTHERYEADDVIGTMALRAVAAGFDVAIVTGDKDFFQLVDDGVRVYNPRDEGAWFDRAGVIEKFGVAPERVVDVLALMGDAIDNVRGVPGIGEKGARDLIASHGGLDDLLARASEVPQKKYREALAAHADEARASRELLRIHTDVPIAFEPETLRYRGPSQQACYELFSELGFRSLVMEYAPTAETTNRDYRIIRSHETLKALADELGGRSRLALRVLTDSPSAMQASIVGLALATDARRAHFVPVSREAVAPVASAPAYQAGASLFSSDAGTWAPPDPGGDRDRLPLRDVLVALGPILESPAIAKVGHDLKFDTVVLSRYGVTLAGLSFDTMLGSYLLDATRSGHPLEPVALEYVGYKALTEEDICGRGVKSRPLAELAPDVVFTYAGERADLALQLADRLQPLLHAEKLDDLYREFEHPLIPVLAAMEQTGIRVDVKALAGQSDHVERELARRSAQIFELAGETFNINSPPQLSKVLFEKLQLPTLKRNVKTKTASTAVEVLEELAVSHELPRLILEWRALQKLKGTYIDALPGLGNPSTGRVHTSFNQGVAATGRLSSSSPNLQNIPIRTELGREIRRAFVADAGHVLISADYSQIELRVLAHLAGDETLIAAFQRGEDIHDRTARQVFGESSALDPHELRRRAKIVNYALLYGKTAFTLAKDIGVTPRAAEEFIDAYFAGFPRVRAFIDRTLEEARVSGAVKTLYGRRRLVPELNSRNTQDRSRAEREAVNMPIQGTAADIMKRAMIQVHAALDPASGARMLLTVHDELLLEAPESNAEEIAGLVRASMEGAAALDVPLTVDIGVGANWKEAKQ
jgi:DNA polymerase-1